MNPTAAKTCRNCAASIPSDAQFCPNCSQKYTTGKVPFYQFLQDFFEHYFNLDSRFFRTMAALFIPGKLTKEYFLGKHKSYSKPLQLFLVPAFFLFALVSSNIAKTDFGDNAFISLKEDLDWIEFYVKLDSAKVYTDSIFSDPIIFAATDTLRQRLKAHNPNLKDSLDIQNYGTFDMVSSIPTISKKDLLEKSSSELVEMYGKDRSFMEKVFLGQVAKLKKGGRGVVNFFISKLSLILLLMMPVLAIILKLLYFRRGYYYVEHLVFTFHFHAFAFIIIILLALFGSYLNEFIAVALGLSIFIYLFLAMKRVYLQGSGKTTLKYMILLLSYLMLSIGFSVFAFIVSFMLF